MDLQYAEFLPEGEQILRDYWIEHSSAQESEPIMQAAHYDAELVVGLVCLSAVEKVIAE